MIGDDESGRGSGSRVAQGESQFVAAGIQADGLREHLAGGVAMRLIEEGKRPLRVSDRLQPRQ